MSHFISQSRLLLKGNKTCKCVTRLEFKTAVAARRALSFFLYSSISIHSPGKRNKVREKKCETVVVDRQTKLLIVSMD